MRILSSSITEVFQKLCSRDLTAAELLELCLRRVDHVKELNAFISVTEEMARRQASDSDQRHDTGGGRGVLDGVPIAVKDNFCVSGTVSSCGSRMLANFRPPYTASVVSRLLDAGAVLLGKTNLDEFAMGNTGAQDNDVGELDTRRTARPSSTSASHSSIELDALGAKERLDLTSRANISVRARTIILLSLYLDRACGRSIINKLCEVISLWCSSNQAMEFMLFGATLVGSIGTLSSFCPAMAVLSSPSLRDLAMFQMLANLSLSESFFLFAVTVTGVLNILGVPRGPVVCSTALSLLGAAAISSSFALLAISVERYVSVIHGLRYHDLLNDTNRKLLIASSWLVGAGFWFFFTLQMIEFGYWENYQGVCLLLNVTPSHLLCVTFATILVLSITVLIMNVTVSRQAVRHSHEINAQRRLVGLSEEENPMRGFWGIFQASMVVLLLIIPANVTMLIDLLHTPVSPVLKQVVTVGIISVYCIDGWIFGFYNSQLRARYREMFFGETPARSSGSEIAFDGFLGEYAETEFVEGIEFEDEVLIPVIVVEEPSGSVHSVEAGGVDVQLELPEPRRQQANDSAEESQEPSTWENTSQNQQMDEATDQRRTSAHDGSHTAQSTTEAYEAVAGCCNFVAEHIIGSADVENRTVISDLLYKSDIEHNTDVKQGDQNIFGMKSEENYPGVKFKPSRTAAGGVKAGHDTNLSVYMTVEETSDNKDIKCNGSLSQEKEVKEQLNTPENIDRINQEVNEKKFESTESSNLPRRNISDNDNDSDKVVIVSGIRETRSDSDREPQVSSDLPVSPWPANRSNTIVTHHSYQHGGTSESAAGWVYRLPSSYSSSEMPPVE